MSRYEPVYDFCVVGAGMVGSAAAKWLAQEPGKKVCLIGPPEPTQEEWHSEKRQIFSSYYDEGRITRSFDADYVWGLLSHRSIQRYRDLERESGINFYSEVGSMYIALEDNPNLPLLVQNANRIGLKNCNVLSSDGIKALFPYLQVTRDCKAVWQCNQAGCVSPRKLVAALQAIAKSHGCDIIDDTVLSNTDVNSSDGSNIVQILCETGRKVLARRVLLCTGAFTNFHNLLPGNKQVDFNPCKTIVVKAEVTEEYAKEKSNMPSILARLPNREVYILPPIKYPDGKYYLKIGRGPRGTELHTPREISDWFKSEGVNDKIKEQGLSILKSFLPDLDPVSVTTSTCVSSHTPTDRFFCDMVTPRLGTVMGMTGRGAKCCDEIGRMGAQMIASGEYSYDLPAEYFRLRYKKAHGTSKL